MEQKTEFEKKLKELLLEYGVTLIVGNGKLTFRSFQNGGDAIKTTEISAFVEID